jgi:hypothetical protein
MSDTLFFSVAVFVFVMMAIGLVFTVLEFRYGQPRREGKKARAHSKAIPPRRTRLPALAQSR